MTEYLRSLSRNSLDSSNSLRLSKNLGTQSVDRNGISTIEQIIEQLQITCIDYIEPKPGIPPTPRHVSEVITLMRDRGIRVLFSTNYYDANQVRSVAAKTGAMAVMVPSNAEGAPETDTYVPLVSLWIRQLRTAFAGRAAHP